MFFLHETSFAICKSRKNHFCFWYQKHLSLCSSTPASFDVDEFISFFEDKISKDPEIIDSYIPRERTGRIKDYRGEILKNFAGDVAKEEGKDQTLY